MIKENAKRLFASVSSVAVLTASIPLAPFALKLDNFSLSASADDSGDLYGVSWCYEEATRTMTFSGESENTEFKHPIWEDEEGGFYEDDCFVWQYWDWVVPTTIDFSGVTNIDVIKSDMFNDYSEIKKVILPECLKTIEDYAFYASGIKSITIPENVTKLGEGCFAESGSLESVTFEGTTPPTFVCGWDTPFGNDNISMIFVPDSAVEAYQQAFVESGAFSEEWVKEHVFSVDDDIDICTVTFEYEDVAENDTKTILAGETVQIPNVNEPWQYRFDGWYTDTSYQTPFDFDEPITESTTAYAKWSVLVTIHLDDEDLYNSIEPFYVTLGSTVTEPNLPELEKRTFEKWVCNGSIFNFSQPITKPVTIDGYWIINQDSCGDDLSWFYDLDTKTLFIKGTGTVLKGDSYYSGLDIKRINFDGAPNLSVLGTRSFYNCDSIESLILPDTITEIGDEAFMYSENLRSCVVPGSVKTIGTRSFGGCVNLEILKLSSGLESIGDAAIYDTSIDCITIPDTVKHLGAMAIYTRGMKSAVFLGQIPPVIDEGNEKIFGERTTTDLCYILCPVNCLSAYKAAIPKYQDWIYESTVIPEGCQVTVKENLDISFYFSIDKTAEANNEAAHAYPILFNPEKAEFQSSNGQVIPIKDATKTEDGQYVFTVSVPAKNMYDLIGGTVYNLAYQPHAPYSEYAIFSFADYAEAVAAENPSLSKYLDSLLTYGQCAAAYFDNESAPICTKTFDYDAIIEQLSLKYSNAPETSEGFEFASMVLESTPLLRLYYNSADAVEGLTESPKNPGLYYIEKPFKPTEFSNTMDNFAVYNYIYLILKSKEDAVITKELKDLCAALYEISVF